ncbi:MAG: glycosyl hydrolase family 98 [Bacteroidales bacterium]|nr:glycosyl hydrolase family 98 [Bacteroidales bacterium]
MKKIILFFAVILFIAVQSVSAQQRRPIDNEHPMWFIHVDVWYKADPQKIIDLIPDDIKPYVCLNLSLSCQYDAEKNVYKMPQQAVRTYKSWATVCQLNGMWFSCQPASGGHTHIQDDDLETFEYFFKQYPNFLGWNYAEQFWGFEEPGDLSSSSQSTRLALFAKLVEMSHKYGGLLTVSFCGNVWSHALNPVGMMKREPKLLEACKKYPESILWLYKYTTSSCFYNNESVSFSPFISGLANNYGVRYDNCGWNGALDEILGKNNGKSYPASAGVGTVLEQTGINGGAVWDGPELTWNAECFHEVGQSDVEGGYKRRNWAQFDNFKGVWADMFRKVIDGTVHIPSREEVINRMKIVVINDIYNGSDEEKYAAWGDLYDGLYKQDDPFNRKDGQWMDNFCYFKKTGRYATIPICIGLYDALAKSIPVQVKKSQYATRWKNQDAKVADFNEQYPKVSEGDLFVARSGNQLVAYTPYTYLNNKTTASASIPLVYNTCDKLELKFNQLSGGLVREYGDRIVFYLNNFRTDNITQKEDIITIKGANSKPTFSISNRNNTNCTTTENWSNGIYTLTVKHCGPLDLIVNCSGNNSRPEAPAVKALSLPKQPEAYYGPIIIEAEDMDFKNIKNCCIDPFNNYPSIVGQAGNGFVDMGTDKTGSLRHRLTLKKGGDYRIAVRYLNTAKAGNLTVIVNGNEQTIPVEKAENNEWKKSVFNASLISGVNELIINNTDGISMYIDQIIYTPSNIEDEKFNLTIRPTESGTVTADKNVASEGETIKLTINPQKGWQLAEIRVVNSVYFTQGKKIPVTAGATEVSFTMPDDNWTILPVFKETAAVVKTDFTNTLTGSLPEGWVCIQENNEIHEYPNTYTSGARMMSGFTGYDGKGLYWREKSTEYGSQDEYPLELNAGKYKLTFAMAAWHGDPDFRVEILDLATGSVVASSGIYTAFPNVDRNTSADISSARMRELSFTIKTQGKYVISFSNLAGDCDGMCEFLLLSCKLTLDDDDNDSKPTPTSEIIDLLSGISVWSFDKTIYIKAQPGEYYQIIDINGRILKSGVTQSDREEVTIGSRASGIAIVRIARRSFKVRY